MSCFTACTQAKATTAFLHGSRGAGLGWPDATVSDDGRFVIVSITQGTFPETQVGVLDLEDPEGGYRDLTRGFRLESVRAHQSGQCLLRPDRLGGSATKDCTQSTSTTRPGKRGARSSARQRTASPPDGAYFYGGRLVCHYLHDAELRGSASTTRRFICPRHPTARTVGGNRQPPRPRGDRGPGPTRTSSPFRRVLHASPPRSSGAAIVERVKDEGAAALRRTDRSGLLVTGRFFATSGDGTKIPLFLARRREVCPNGDVPVLLYGYGGFGIPVTPAILRSGRALHGAGSAVRARQPRGGGEYGKAWHDAGRLANKQNAFDDFSACARWLVDSGWLAGGPDRDHRRIERRSLGRGVLDPAPGTVRGGRGEGVGVLDMLRFPKFTIGWAWTPTSGDPDDPEQYRWLHAYSPLHNLRQDGRYPATLLLTGDHDDRVVPGHSFKFAAALQQAQAADRPVFLPRRDRRRPRSGQADRQAHRGGQRCAGLLGGRPLPRCLGPATRPSTERD